MYQGEPLRHILESCNKIQKITHFKIKYNKVNRLTMDQLANVHIAIDKVHRVLQRLLDYR